jgi:hypothetical protein
MSMTNNVFLILFFFALPTMAQQGNPFDVERVPLIQDSLLTPSDHNIFDINRVAQDTSKTQKANQATDTTSKKETTAQPRYLGDGSNPFEVDHVPTRKRDIQRMDKSKSENDSPTSSNLFVFWLTLFSLIILAIVLNTQKSTLPKLFKSLTNENILKLNKREEASGVSAVYLLLYCVYFSTFSAFLYLLLQHFIITSGGLLIWFYLLLAILFVYSFRHFAMFVFGSFFPVSKEVSLYNFTIISFNLVLGLVLIPINLLLAFGPESLSSSLIYLALSLIALIFILRFLRGLFIAIPYLTANTFHFLLYLCTFEIAPILLVYKELVQMSQ